MSSMTMLDSTLVRLVSTVIVPTDAHITQYEPLTNFDRRQIIA